MAPPGYWDWKKKVNRRFWGFCADFRCKKRGCFISVREGNIRCPHCKSENIMRETEWLIYAICQSTTCPLSERGYGDGKIQEYQPEEDARCSHCHGPVEFHHRKASRRFQRYPYPEDFGGRDVRGPDGSIVPPGVTPLPAPEPRNTTGEWWESSAYRASTTSGQAQPSERRRQNAARFKQP